MASHAASMSHEFVVTAAAAAARGEEGEGCCCMRHISFWSIVLSSVIR